MHRRGAQMGRCQQVPRRQFGRVDHGRLLPSTESRHTHHCALPYAKVPRALAALHRCDAWPGAKLLFEFLVLTAVCTEEARGALTRGAFARGSSTSTRGPDAYCNLRRVVCAIPRRARLPGIGGPVHLAAWYVPGAVKKIRRTLKLPSSRSSTMCSVPFPPPMASGRDAYARNEGTRTNDMLASRSGPA